MNAAIPAMIAIAGGKGGSGKTTTTLGLAIAAAESGRRAVAVDADRDMPDLHALAGLAPDPTLSTAATDLGAAAQPLPETNRASVVPAHPDDDADDLRATLRAVRRAQGVGFVDCPAGASPDAVTPLRAADRAVVVATPTPAGVRDAAKSAAIARAVDTPVVVGALTGTESVPHGVERVLEAPVIGVPQAEDPPFAPDPRSAYRRLYRHLTCSAPAPGTKTAP